MNLSAIVLAIWQLLSPSARHLPTGMADDVAWAVEHDGRRGDVPADVEAAVVAYYMFKESRLQRRPYAVSWDAAAGKSCDVLQMPCNLVRGRSVREQVGTWLGWVHDVGIAAVDSDPARAQKRVAKAVELLAKVRSVRFEPGLEPYRTPLR